MFTNWYQDEELGFVSGGVSEGDEITDLSKLTPGDIVEISDYPLAPGTYCFIYKNSSNAYRFLIYDGVTHYPDNGVSFQTIPTGAHIKKIGHDEKFAKDNDMTSF